MHADHFAELGEIIRHAVDPTPAERFKRERDRALEAVTDAVRDFADTLDYEDAEDFKEDCRYMIGELQPTERQAKFAAMDYEDQHPRRPQ